MGPRSQTCPTGLAAAVSVVVQGTAIATPDLDDLALDYLLGICGRVRAGGRDVSRKAVACIDGGSWFIDHDQVDQTKYLIVSKVPSRRELPRAL